MTQYEFNIETMSHVGMIWTKCFHVFAISLKLDNFWFQRKENPIQKGVLSRRKLFLQGEQINSLKSSFSLRMEV